MYFTFIPFTSINTTPGSFAYLLSSILTFNCCLIFYYFLFIINSLADLQFFLDFYHPWTFPGVSEVPHKIWTRSVLPFWRLLDTNKQTKNQTVKNVFKIPPPSPLYAIDRVRLFPNLFIQFTCTFYSLL